MNRLALLTGSLLIAGAAMAFALPSSSGQDSDSFVAPTVVHQWEYENLNTAVLADFKVVDLGGNLTLRIEVDNNFDGSDGDIPQLGVPSQGQVYVDGSLVLTLTPADTGGLVGQIPADVLTTWLGTFRSYDLRVQDAAGIEVLRATAEGTAY